jgi:transposase
VISDVFWVSGREMLAALIAGQRSPRILAQMSHGTMRSKIAVLEEALTGHFEDHHGFLLNAMLDHVDSLTSQVEAVSARIEAVIAPFSRDVERFDEIVGVGITAAQELIAEIGVDVTRFPSAAHLVSWAKFAPIDRNSAGTKRGGSTGKGNPWLAGTIGEIVASASRTDTFLGERYRRLARRRGKSRAIVAVGNSVLTIIWHLLADPEARYQDLGGDYYQTKINTRRRERALVRQLEQLTGKKVTLAPTAAA